MENVHPTLPCSPDHSRSQLLTEIVYALTSKYGELALRDGDPRRLTQWRFKDFPSAIHLGPMAQDFRAAFGLGLDDKSIATVDADGVALAAIKERRA